MLNVITGALLCFCKCRDLESDITRLIKYLLLFKRLFVKWTRLTVISNYKKKTTVTSIW